MVAVVISSPQCLLAAKVQVRAAPANQAAQPRMVASTAANIAGAIEKYFQFMPIDTNWRTNNAQPSGPMACGLFRASVPRYQVRNARNSRNTVAESPKPT